MKLFHADSIQKNTQVGVSSLQSPIDRAQLTLYLAGA
jgi:hypothetical protein